MLHAAKMSRVVHNRIWCQLQNIENCFLNSWEFILFIMFTKTCKDILLCSLINRKTPNFYELPEQLEGFRKCRNVF